MTMHLCQVTSLLIRLPELLNHSGETTWAPDDLTPCSPPTALDCWLGTLFSSVRGLPRDSSNLGQRGTLGQCEPVA